MIPKLSISEARAEAASLVLRHVLESVPKREAERIREAAMHEARATGVEAVMDEMGWLLSPPELD
jgi:hypothetical protein